MRSVCLLTALLTAACTDYVQPAPGSGTAPQTAPPTSSEAPPPASSPLYPLAVGATTGVRPGYEVGYGVTAIGPNAYRITWTGDATVAGTGYREFSGSIWTSGRFTSVTPGCGASACPLEDGDYVSAPIAISQGERIDWDTYASVGFDGFDVTTDGGEVYVDALVDGARRADLVYLPLAAQGGHVVSPTLFPFAVVTP